MTLKFEIRQEAAGNGTEEVDKKSRCTCAHFDCLVAEKLLANATGTR